MEVMAYKGLEAGTHMVGLKEKTRKSSQCVWLEQKNEEGGIGGGCEVREKAGASGFRGIDQHIG